MGRDRFDRKNEAAQIREEQAIQREELEELRQACEDKYRVVVINPKKFGRK